MSRAGGHLGWLLGAVAAAGSAVLALTAPASWWGATFVLSVLGGMLAARRVVPVAYRPAWTRSVVIVTLGASCAGGSYAFAVEPWGPVPGIAWTLGLLLLVAVFVPVSDLASVGWRRTMFLSERDRRPRDWMPPEERPRRR